MPFPKFNLTPQQRRPIRLFANTGEAIVFWISVAAVLFLGILYGFRYFTGKQADSIAAQYQHEIQLMQTQIDSLANELDRLKAQMRERNQQAAVDQSPVLLPIQQKSDAASVPPE